MKQFDKPPMGRRVIEISSGSGDHPLIEEAKRNFQTVDNLLDGFKEDLDKINNGTIKEEEKPLLDLENRFNFISKFLTDGNDYLKDLKDGEVPEDVLDLKRKVSDKFKEYNVIYLSPKIRAFNQTNTPPGAADTQGIPFEEIERIRRKTK